MKTLNNITLIIFLLSALSLNAQTQLVPDWIQTRSHGSGQNGRLAVDTVWGLLYWTLSTDDISVTIPHAELNVFDYSGTDFTPVPVDQLNLYTGTGPLERESIEDPRMNFDTLVVALYDQVSPGFDRSTLTEWVVTEVVRSVTYFGANNTSIIMDVWADEQGMLVIMDQAQRYVHGFNADWLPLWQNVAGQQYAIAGSSDKVFLAQFPHVTVFDRTTGSQLMMFDVNNSSLANNGVLTVNGNALYHAYQANDTMHIGSTDLSGNSIWDISVYFGDAFNANEIIVDEMGTVWVGSSLDTDIALDHTDGGRLISVDPSGSFLQYYTFGSTITDIAFADGTIFVCGKLDSAATTSYLLAAQLDMPTGILLRETTTNKLFIYPQPATDQVTLQWDTRLGEQYNLTIYDAFGRVVDNGKRELQNGSCNIDLNNISSGIYVVEVRGDKELFLSKQLIVH